MFRVLTGWLMLSLINFTTSSEEFCLTKCKVFVEPSVCNGEMCIMEDTETGQGVLNSEECETKCDEDTETCDSEAVKVTGEGNRDWETVYTIAKCVPLNSEEGMEQETDQETDPITAANSVTTDGDAVTAPQVGFGSTEKPEIITKCAKCRNPDLSHIDCFDDPDDDEECPDGEACYIFPISSPVTVTIEQGPTIKMTDHFEMCVQVDQVNKNSASVCKWDQCDLLQNFHEKGNVPVEPTTGPQTTAAKTTAKATSPPKEVTLGAVDGCAPACTGAKVACHHVTWTSTSDVEYRCYKINTGACGTSCTWKICDNVGGPCFNEGTTAMSPTTEGETTNNAVETESQDTDIDNNYDNDAEAVEGSSSSSLSHIKGIIIALITYLLRA